MVSLSFVSIEYSAESTSRLNHAIHYYENKIKRNQTNDMVDKRLFFLLDIRRKSEKSLCFLFYPIGGGAGSTLSNPFLLNSQYVFIFPLPLISIPPRGSI